MTIIQEIVITNYEVVYRSMSSREYTIGIDEVGRGPLAGPVYVGIIMAPNNFDFGIFPHLKDSKKMTEKRRGEVYQKLLSISGEILFTTRYTTAKLIDRNGINPAIQSAISRGLNSFRTEPERSEVLLDGGLSAPDVYPNQETIVGGDDLMPIISLASVLAKVTRDSRMQGLHQRYPEYNLAQNKGYGTKEHREMIRQHGVSPIHRRTYLKNIISE